MGAATVESLNALCFVHIEGGTEERSVIVVVEVEESALAVKLLAHIIRAIEFATVLEL